MAAIGQGVTLRGLIPQIFAWTWNVSGFADGAKPEGQLVAQDVTAANTVKAMGDGDAPIGALATYEDRKIEGIKIGTVNHKGGFPVVYTGALAIGDSVVGTATAGVLKKAGAPNRAVVVEIVDATNAIVVFI